MNMGGNQAKDTLGNSKQCLPFIGANAFINESVFEYEKTIGE